jgi:hypothetical protein
MENPIHSIRIIRKPKEFLSSRRANSSYTYTEKDSTRFSPSTNKLEGFHSRFFNNFKDPRKKGHRFDYRIFFSKKFASRNETRPITANERKKTISPFPARFCLINKKEAKKLRVENHAESDLQLIRDINANSNRSVLELEKVYRNYILNFQIPAGTEGVTEKNDEVVYSNKHKRVRFDLTHH